MKWAKYFFAVLFIVLIIGTLPSVVLIAKGLINGQADNSSYFIGKLVGYLVIIGLLAFASIKLIKNAKK